MKTYNEKKIKGLKGALVLIEISLVSLHEYSEHNNGAIFPEIGMIEAAVRSIRYKELKTIAK